ncbi:amidohydrolase family protein [Pseudonocardia dioxanivorans]|uniref:amidohydrolase family protein n=1 Tax=Pseudonocardia dioxanivorans TaxID=240495 RepID=UPI000CD21793|nr:amidohydrolase family protein [Pseudonocardia dioxanivorans]
MIPFHMWGETFGEEIAEKLAPCETSPFFADNGANTAVRPDLTGDDTEISHDSVWNLKGCAAPAAIDVSRRPAVMDEQGIDRALMFPSFGLVGVGMASSPQWASSVLMPWLSVEETRTTGLKVIEAHNAWVIRTIHSVDARRLRPVALLLTDSVESMLSQLRFLIDNGVKAFWLPSGAPPAGTSPADAALDPFWRLAADNDVAVLIHIGTDHNLVASPMWSANVEAFVPPLASAEFVLSPFASATAQIGAEHFLTAMVLGGTFERVPNLRVGTIELGAQWFGPLADRLDLWARVFPRAMDGVISKKPSEYLARNVRVTPFHFEEIGSYFDSYPALEDCYAYASDYPHVEGGQDSKKTFADQLAGHDDRVVRKFFVDNGAWLVP